MSFVSLTIATLALALCTGVNMDVKESTEATVDLSRTATAKPALPQKWHSSYEQARQLAARHDLPLLLQELDRRRQVGRDHAMELAVARGTEVDDLRRIQIGRAHV